MDLLLPNFIIIGAMKCATSTLHEQLARQPGIFMTEPKEPSYFSNDEIYARGASYYRGLFAHGVRAALRGESSTHYTKLPTYPATVPRMRGACPQLKLVYVMRHPVDRLVSHYLHEWSMRVIDTTLDAAVERHPELVDYGRYHMQLTPFVESYGRAAILPVFAERLQREPQAELQRVCAFLGYEGTPAWAHEVARQNVSSERLRLGKLGRRLFEDPLLAQLRRRLIPRFVRDRLKDRLMMKERPELSAAARAKLEARFDEDLARLGAVLGVPLSCATWRELVLSRPLSWV